MTTRKEAENELDDTIRRLAGPLDLCDEGEVITDWILTGAVVSPDKEGVTSYFFATHGDLPAHSADGLLRLAMRQVEMGAED